MCRVRCRLFWLGIIAILGTVGCSGDSAPPLLAIRAPVAERQKQPEPEIRPAAVESVAPRTIEPERSVVFIPDTPDGTVRAVFQGLRDGHPEVVWDALPASYQRDLNDIFHLAASRLNPEAWRWAQKIAGKGARLAKASLENTASLDDSDDQNDQTGHQREAIRMVEIVLERFSKCGSDELDRLKSADMGDMLRTNGQAMWKTAIDFMAALDSGFANALQRSLQVTVALKDIAGDSAVVEIGDSRSSETATDFVRIEGRWIPSALAEQWAGAIAIARKAVFDILPSEMPSENFGLTFQALALVEFSVDASAWEIEHPGGDVDGLLCDGYLSSVRQALMLLGYWIGGPPTIEPDFHKKTKKESLSAKGKTTVVYCYADKALKFDNESVDYDLAKHVASQLSAHKIKVVDPDRFYAWLGKNGHANKPSEIGTTFKVDYVIHIDLADFSLFEYHSESLMRGRADCTVSVIKMNEDKNDGDVIYTHSINSNFPIRGAVDSTSMPLSEFKKRYLSVLSDEISRLFYSKSADDDIPTADDAGR